MARRKFTREFKQSAVKRVNEQGKFIPEAAANAFDAIKPDGFNPAEHFASVQSVAVDGRDRLWRVDAGSFSFAPILNAAPKLWRYILATGPRGQVAQPFERCRPRAAITRTGIRL